MQFSCTITRLSNGDWSVRHVGPSLGAVEVIGKSRQETLEKMRREIVYRLELCPCSGENYQHADIELITETGQG